MSIADYEGFDTDVDHLDHRVVGGPLLLPCTFTESRSRDVSNGVVKRVLAPEQQNVLNRTHRER